MKLKWFWFPRTRQEWRIIKEKCFRIFFIIFDYRCNKKLEKGPILSHFTSHVYVLYLFQKHVCFYFLSSDFSELSDSILLNLSFCCEHIFTIVLVRVLRRNRPRGCIYIYIYMHIKCIKHICIMRRNWLTSL